MAATASIVTREPEETRLYTIGEASDLLGISISSIRSYERLGLIIAHRRSSKHRRFTEGDLERIRCIRKLLDHSTVTLESLVTKLATIPCWQIMGCLPEETATCPAYKQRDEPCWNSTDKTWACRASECRECPVYATISSKLLGVGVVD